MRKAFWGLPVALIVLWLLSGCTDTLHKQRAAPLQGPAQTAFTINNNTALIQSLEINLTGKQSKDKVSLYAEQSTDGLPLAWYLVVNGLAKVKLTAEDLYSFAEVRFADLDGDGRAEALLFRQSSGSAGARGLNIYQTAGQHWQELFSVNQDTVTNDKRYAVTYIGNYCVAFEDKETGLTGIIRLNESRYRGSEHMLPDITAWIDPIIDYSLADYNQDGIKEIVTIQRVIGIAHADTIGLLKTTYQLKGNRYQAVTLTLCDSNDTPLAEVKLI
ncbi:hypothetical protein [Desulforamulus hydrothermalis]|uniref:Lipoprotein n=1 Tax=Desulforamulus hydrothermalis Lam5 = DSM 18033 TaxID=1121428 RepID=K8E911_9FIRM|nr:hypothetical protein [Desulforamulus hydrothermalis]CCO08008.1 conserved hypothetical protein [Desulforamulus hydrothermalis Lam5 = DSM 18033]SHG84270.1 hypothetical protein SAMN02745177_00545 [Desulforamulus hydrothermalis Lam5 = DSM 18033]